MRHVGCVLEEFKHGVVFIRMLLGNEFIVAIYIYIHIYVYTFVHMEVRGIAC
jgi:hypothetical protein